MQLWGMQRRILRSVAAHPLTAVKACHSSGKTYTAAGAVVWWISMFPDGLVLTTAPTGTQVRTLLWSEIHRALTDRVVDLDLLTTEAHTKDGQLRALGRATNQGVRFQGFHGRILIVVDEAPGMRPDIWDAIEGIRAGGDVRVLALGNPVVAGGAFYDLFTSPTSRWQRMTISAFDTPNFAGVTLPALLGMTDAELAENPYPYLTKKSWVREMYDKWGPGHPDWDARVMGDFPSQSDLAIFPLALVDAAARPAADGGGPVTFGVDVAGAGRDETVVYARAGGAVLDLFATTSADARGDVTSFIARFASRKIDSINVDAIGVGYYFAQHLMSLGYPVRLVNVSEASSHPMPDTSGPGYQNLKSEMYWSFRERLRDGEISGLADDLTRRQLAVVQWSNNAKGQIVIESKDELAQRSVPSPDRAEALLLAFLPPARQNLIAPAPLELPKVSLWNR